MKTFILHGDMADKFCKEVKLDTKTMQETINALSSQFSGFRKYYLNKLLSGVQFIFVDNFNLKYEQYCYHLPLRESTYHIMPSVEGSLGGNLMTFGLNLGLGYLMQKLSNATEVQDDGTPEYEIITTNSFIYSDNENRAEQGTPIPVVYGQLRVGSKLIHSSIQNYDYDYDNARIYEGFPRRTRLSKIANGGDYSFIDPSDITDWRDGTSDQFSGYNESDPTKRLSLKAIINRQGEIEKKYDASHENEAFNSSFVNNDKGSNELKEFGPSEGSPKYVRANAGWWDFARYNKQARPFIFPKEGHIDYNMRPKSAEEFCIKRIIQSNSPPTKIQDAVLGWRDSNKPLLVGARGSYQKLESIGVYKSLEVLSEGPIAGLANPITGTARDNGFINYPYDAQSVAPPESLATLEDVKYDFTNNRIISLDNDNSVGIVRGGSFYRDGTYLISGDGTVNNGISIKADDPIETNSARIASIDFQNPSFNNPRTVYHIHNQPTPTEPKFVSLNGLFLLNSGDGAIHPNTNSDNTIPNFIDSKYLTSEVTDDAGTTGVYQLSTLEADRDILDQNTFQRNVFSIGSSYGSEPIELTVSPDNDKFEYYVDIQKASFNDRISQAIALDGSLRYSSPNDPTFTEVFYREYVNRTDSTIFGTNKTWDESARIYYDGGTEVQNNLNTTITVRVFTYRCRTNPPFCNGTGGTRNETVSFTLRDYLNLNRVFLNPRVCGNCGVRSQARIFGTTYYIQPTSPANTSNPIDIFNPTSRTNGAWTNGMPLSNLLLNRTFANEVVTAFRNAGVDFNTFTTPSAMFGPQGGEVLHGGGLYIKYGVGSGGATAPGVKVQGGNGSNNLPSYVTLGNNDNFTSVNIQDNGSIDIDDSSVPKGYYFPYIYPRVTVFVLRRLYTIANTQIFDRYEWAPTKIDAVARVSPQGTIADIVLLRVPDNPVYDRLSNSYTPIMPTPSDANGRRIPFIINNGSPSTSYTDLAIACKIDPSNDYETASLDIVNGRLFTNATRRKSFKGEPSWEDHIRLNEISLVNYTRGAGVFQESINIGTFNQASPQTRITSVSEVPDHINTPTTEAQVITSSEFIPLSNGNFKIGALTNLTSNVSHSFLHTGRPIGIAMFNNGNGYTGKDSDVNGTTLSKDIYQDTFTVTALNLIDTQTNNRGYKPDDVFYIHGISSTKQNVVSSANQAYYQFKARVTTNNLGAISKVSIIDGGIGFDNLLDKDDLVIAERDIGSSTPNVRANQIIYIIAQNQSIITAINDVNKTFPNIHFPKQDLILKVDDNYLNQAGFEGKILKFYIKQIGKGFVWNQLMLDPLAASSIIYPAFDVTIANGSFQSVAINQTHTTKGYSSKDNRIGLTVGFPTAMPGRGTNDPTLDPNAWARSIYLNDIPIRDRDDRFNVSKFHFDMRIGHTKNGIGESNILDNTRLTAETRPRIISDEFKIPSYTHTFDYPLFGPRNDGEKDYYFSFTIKNPDVSNISISIRLNELHYIYEGDESALYVNLIPLLAAVLGLMLGKFIADGIAKALIPDPIYLSSYGNGMTLPIPFCGAPGGVPTVDNLGGTGWTAMKTGELAKEAAILAAFGALIGAVGGWLISEIANSLIKCSDVPWLCFKVGEIIKNSGEIWPAKTSLAIEYGIEGEDLLKDVIEFNGCATNPYVKDILIENLPKAKSINNNYKNRIVKVYRLNREMDPVVNGITEARYKIDASVHAVTEYVEGFFSYPNTAIIGCRVNSKDQADIPNREYLLKGRLLDIPSNYNAENGTYVGTWNGQFTSSEWTSNPAWIIYDLLINRRYGLGKYDINEDNIDKWSFYEFAQFCDERVDVVIEGSATTERRHMCNLYIDTEVEAYQYIKDLMYIYNSSINFTGGKIYIEVDSSKKEGGTIQSTLLFNNANVTEEGFAYSSTPETDRITAVTVDFLDERDNYLQKTEYVEDTEGIEEHGYKHIKIAGIGITRRGEAHRLAWHKILTKQLEKELVQFKTGLIASYARIGDVIEVMDNNKIAKHAGGRIVRVINSTTVEIDIPASALSNVTDILIESNVQQHDNWDGANVAYTLGDIVLDVNDGKYYRLIVANVGANAANLAPSKDSTKWSSDEIQRDKQFESYTITARNGFEITLNSTLDASIKQGYSWIADDNTTDKIKPRTYKIVKISENNPMQFEIIAKQYIEDKYEQVDNSTSSKDGIYIEEREYYGHDITV